MQWKAILSYAAHIVMEASSESAAQCESVSKNGVEDRVVIDMPGFDVTLISCDNAKFRVHRSILSVASPFFEGMFDIATSSTPKVEITMAECASVLETLVRFIYPISPRSELVTINQVRPVLHAAEKLEMHSIEGDIRSRLRDMLANDSNPLRAWALATSFDEEASRQSAMLRFLCVDDDKLPTLVSQAIEAFQYVSAGDYVLLLRWRADAIKEARAIRMTKTGRVCGSHMSIYSSSVGASVRPLSDICPKSTNPLFLWDQPDALVRTWLQGAAWGYMKCGCAALFSFPESVAHLLSELRLVMNKAKGQPGIRLGYDAPESLSVHVGRAPFLSVGGGASVD